MQEKEKSYKDLSINEKLDKIYAETPVKRFNLGFGIIGVPEQHKHGTYCTYNEALAVFGKLQRLVKEEENKVWELTTFKIPELKAYYRHRIATAIFILFPLGYIFGRLVS